jgi:hypothetical protein
MAVFSVTPRSGSDEGSEDEIPHYVWNDEEKGGNDEER